MTKPNYDLDETLELVNLYLIGQMRHWAQPQQLGKKSFRTLYNRTPDPIRVDVGASQTIPDQSLTIKQILERYAQGRPLSNVQHNGASYTGDAITFEPKKMDYVHLQELMDQNKQNIIDLQKQIDQMTQSDKTAPKQGEAKDDERSEEDANEPEEAQKVGKKASKA